MTVETVKTVKTDPGHVSQFSQWAAKFYIGLRNSKVVCENCENGPPGCEIGPRLRTPGCEIGPRLVKLGHPENDRIGESSKKP